MVVVAVLMLVLVGATYSRTTAYSSVLMPVGSGAASFESEGDVAAAAGWRSFARAHVAAYTAVARQSAVRFIVAVEVAIELVVGDTVSEGVAAVVVVAFAGGST